MGITLSNLQRSHLVFVFFILSCSFPPCAALFSFFRIFNFFLLSSVVTVFNVKEYPIFYEFCACDFSGATPGPRLPWILLSQTSWTTFQTLLASTESLFPLHSSF
jgi:hypothetical protein